MDQKRHPALGFGFLTCKMGTNSYEVPTVTGQGPGTLLLTIQGLRGRPCCTLLGRGGSRASEVKRLGPSPQQRAAVSEVPPATATMPRSWPSPSGSSVHRAKG